jgi:hypothetical protein
MTTDDRETVTIELLSSAMNSQSYLSAHTGTTNANGIIMIFLYAGCPRRRAKYSGRS